MQILTEVVGGVILLIIFAYGMREVVRFDERLNQRRKKNDVQRKPPNDDPGVPPGTGDGPAN